MNGPRDSKEGDEDGKGGKKGKGKKGKGKGKGKKGYGDYGPPPWHDNFYSAQDSSANDGDAPRKARTRGMPITTARTATPTPCRSTIHETRCWRWAWAWSTA